ncbi:pilin [Xanthomonas sp. AmX2]|uniref:pilin n=1 Tax=Xanthomonas sp. TaxID=29446 RepID=UPI00197D2990|nr:pilin [Xanthomonas sp.]
MIVVAIIAILAAIALPMYQDYVAKTQVAAALAEIRAGKTTVENVAQEGRDAALVDADYAGLVTTERCPIVSANLTEQGIGMISCTVSGNGKVNARPLVLRRSADGVWSCDGSAFDSKYRPFGCE